MKKLKLLSILVISIATIPMLFSYKPKHNRNDASIVIENLSNKRIKNYYTQIDKDVLMFTECLKSKNKTMNKVTVKNVAGFNVELLDGYEPQIATKTNPVTANFPLPSNVIIINTYSKEDLILLAQVVEAEAGGDACTNEHRLLVASVVINRVKSGIYPNTIKGVIYQRNQYSSVKASVFKNKPSKRSIKAAKYILRNGSICPKDVLFQAEFRQGSGVYKKFKTYRSTTYFCYYKNEK